MKSARSRVTVGSVVGLVCAMSVYAAPARADGNAEADALYQEAVQAMDASRFAEACAKFEKSQALDPAIGTQFELAGCYEAVGRPFAAYKLFRSVRELAHQAGKSKLEERAAAKVGSLEPRLPRIRIRVAELPSGAHVEIDGESRDGIEIALEPGPHRIRIVSPTTEPWDTNVDARAGATTEVKLGPFVKTVIAAPPPVAPPVRAPLTVPGQRSTWSYIGLGAAGVGVVGVGVGLALGAVASSKNSASKADGLCSDDNLCNDEGLALRRDSLSAARVSTVVTIAGGALVAGGMALFFLAPRKSWDASVAPTTGGGYASLNVRFD